MLVFKGVHYFILKTKHKTFYVAFFYAFFPFGRLQEVSDVAVTQVSALQARQKSNEKEVETLRRQILDFQVTWSWSFTALSICWHLTL